jgi:hypothetical protein
VTLDRFRQSSKQYPQIVSTDEGIKIDASDKHLRNANLPRIETRHPLSNPTYKRVAQRLKHASPMVSIDKGMQIDVNKVQSQNAHFPRSETLLLFSKVRAERSLHP